MDDHPCLESSHSIPQPRDTDSVTCLFDFDEYLRDTHVRQALNDILGPYPADSDSECHPGSKLYNVVKLTGGLINVTARVITTRGNAKGRSVILKYAPPFIAASLERVPFSQFRQTIESRALSILANTPTIVQCQIDSGVRIPKLIWFDEHKHLLALEDLGDGLITLDEWLCPHSDVALDAGTCRSAGTRLGDMLAAIHSDDALHARLGSNDFVNPYVTDLLANEVIGNIRGILMKCLPLREGDADGIQRMEDEATVVSSIIQREYERKDEENGPRRTMFSNGDLWTGTILMSTGEVVDIGLIDWEFAGEGKVLQDLGQFSAWLRLFAQAKGWFDKDSEDLSSGLPFGVSAANQRIRNSRPWIFAKSCFTAYAVRLRASPSHSWLLNAGSQEEERFRLQAIRSTWILHGRELIYNAGSTDAAYKFERVLCGDLERWRRKVVELGCWYVRMAGESPDRDFKMAVEEEEFLSPLYNHHGLS